MDFEYLILGLFVTGICLMIIAFANEKKNLIMGVIGGTVIAFAITLFMFNTMTAPNNVMIPSVIDKPAIYYDSFPPTIQPRNSILIVRR